MSMIHPPYRSKPEPSALEEQEAERQAEAASIHFTWTRCRDTYGRSCHHLYATDSKTTRHIGVVVALPRTSAERYLSNDWTLADRDDAVRYHRTLAEGKARIEEAARR